MAILDMPDWEGTLCGAYDALRPGGHLVFETRDPADRVWQDWNREESYSITEIQGIGAVESWVRVVDVIGPLVRVRWTWVFTSDREVLTSDSTLRFLLVTRSRRYWSRPGLTWTQSGRAGPAWTRARFLRAPSRVTPGALS